MQTKLFALTIALTLFAAACATAPEAAKENKETAAVKPAADAAALPKPDYAAIAQKVVATCAGIKEGDIVSISGAVRDAELMEDLAAQVRKQGAFPLLTFTSDRLERKLYEDVPAKFDAQAPQLALKLAGMVKARISVDSIEDDGRLNTIPMERFWARAKANAAVEELYRKRNVPTIYIGGNGLYPRTANAQQLGMSPGELAKIFWDGINTDYAQLQATCEKYRQLLASGKVLHLTNPNGTDLKVGIANRTIYVSDGVVSPEDVRRGGTAVTVWLPAGEVYLTPVPSTAEGKIVIERAFYSGTEIEGLTLEFKAGKLTAMTARAGLDRLKKEYDSADGDKSAFCLVDVGLNQNINLGAKARRGDYPVAGMVTIGFGGNESYGGEAKSSFRFEPHIPGSTLKVDGKVVVENGMLKP
jgi:leucyl aminopeptidase (aminopeptidase T)